MTAGLALGVAGCGCHHVERAGRLHPRPAAPVLLGGADAGEPRSALATPAPALPGPARLPGPGPARLPRPGPARLPRPGPAGTAWLPRPGPARPRGGAAGTRGGDAIDGAQTFNPTLALLALDSEGVGRDAELSGGGALLVAAHSAAVLLRVLTFQGALA